jgi:hypothetical protein
MHRVATWIGSDVTMRQNILVAIARADAPGARSMPGEGSDIGARAITHAIATVDVRDGVRAGAGFTRKMSIHAFDLPEGAP